MKTLSILLCCFVSTAFYLKEPRPSQEGEIIEVRFGTSFGKCSGYCIQEVALTNNQVAKKLIPHRDKSLEVKTCNQDFSKFEKLVSLIDMEAFDQLEVTIGCPDCADGGAEWIQIITSEGYDKKVTYSYNKAPSMSEPFIDILRGEYEKMKECE